MKYYLGLDVGGTNLAAGIVNEYGSLLFKETMSTNSKGTIEEITNDMAFVSKKLIDKSSVSFNDIISCGIGIPSCINPSTKLLVHANCFGWKNVPIFDYLENKIKLPIFIENDANCAALGETFTGGAKGYNDVIMLTLGTGLGSGIIINKKIYSGADGHR